MAARRLLGLLRARVASTHVCPPHSGSLYRLFLGSVKSTLSFGTQYKCYHPPGRSHRGSF